MSIKIAQFGLGPIGLETLKLAASKPWAEIVGAIDIAPNLVGCDLAKLTGIRSLRGRLVHKNLDDLLEVAKPDLVFHTAVSRFARAWPQLEPMARRGINVVSSCEELVFPQLREPELAARLDQACRQGGARVAGTGVNPGFAMDLLPLCLTGVSRAVRAVHVERVVNASTRRGPLQKKIGSGLAPAKFQRLFHEAKAGHAGLKESLALIAHGLGWKLQKVTEICKAIVARRDIKTTFVRVKRGQTCGLHQRAEGTVSGKTRLSLDLKMYLDAPNPLDSIQIDGDPPLRLLIENGIAGDQATVAALINTAPRLLQTPPGLRLLTDLPAPHLV